ncbi:MAG: hypothetical protein Ct9H300mP11_02740 [Chloroflexota bacterium]|nr:MAG: hypothetical protein Ct9H300mP11_02740 [Chloroflexota bacterium]
MSTVFDKAPVGVARHAKAHGIPTVLLAGSLGEGHEELYDYGVSSVLCISDGAMTFQQALGRTGEMLQGTAERAKRLFLTGRDAFFRDLDGSLPSGVDLARYRQGLDSACRPSRYRARAERTRAIPYQVSRKI